MICSIIIPHHNLVSLLKRCLDSIPDIDDFEVIVVDDNSSKNEVEKLKALTLKKNVKIFYTTEGKGAGYARNKGIELARGEWLLFCDSDDYFFPNMESCVKEYKYSKYDVVFWGFETVDSDTLCHMTSRVIGSKKAFKNNDISYFKYRFHAPWAKLIKKSLVDKYNIRFDEVICSNDTFFSGKVGFYCENPIIDQRLIYVTTVRQGSLVHSMNLESLTIRIFVCTKYNKFLNEINKNKYRINMISLLLYLRDVDHKLCKTYLNEYLKKESLPNIVRDLKKSFTGFLKQKLIKGENMRKHIKISK